ncbi:MULTISPECIES: LysR substrate-binding domain-containing protein [Streptomyces]|uniref:LysR family transcriptional regulator n=1 Tax=Streptomyces viridosporus T7A TaxID=665577 RepID=A0ABX6A7J8_STRVD|nr:MULTISPECIES: LysR substrate-binding domain-containing protein [Streptomyces]PWJ04317.1 LysR family transcriptional regulator [Streptomyces sp. NWU49]QEU83651.1 LysR family transcriptional regulator [Streptomyces viridosporus T7A]
MELRHLRYFAAVADTCHFGKAAERLHMAQPPLSQAIRRLETELGVDLFTRTTRQVALTAAGEVFRTDVERILKAVDEAVARVGRFASGLEGVLRVGLTGSASYRQLPALARLLKREMPHVMMEVHTEMLTPAQELGLIERRLDVGVLRPPIRQEGITHRPLADERLVVAVPEEHWLAEADTVRVEQLRHEDFIMYGAALGSVVNDAVVRSCLASGFYPHCAYEVTETSAALALVAAGFGVAVLPDSIRSAPREGVACKDIEDALSVPLVLAWRAEDDSPLLRNLLEVLERHDVFLEGAA